MRTHAEIKELLAIYDRLGADELTEVNAHVAICAECAGELAEWRRMDRTLRYMPDPAPSASLRNRLPLPRPQPVTPFEQPRARPVTPGLPPPSHAQEEPDPEPAARGKFPWQRVLLPVGLVLLFVGSIWFGLREPSREQVRSVATPAVTASAEGTRQPETTPERALTTIVFTCDDVGAVYRDYAKLARSFEQANPDVSIQLKSFRDLLGSSQDALSYEQTMQEISASADAFCVWEVGPLVEAHLLYKLDPLVANDPSFDAADFYEAVLNGVRHDGALYAVPSHFQPALIRYDPDAFDGARLPHPEPGWTWNDFATAAKVLTVREEGNTQRWGFGEDRPAVFQARLAEAFQDPDFAAAARSAALLSSPEVNALFRWYEDLYANDRSAFPSRGVSDPGRGSAPADVYRSQILRGKLAMWTDQLYEGARRRGKPAPMPQDSGAGGAPIYTRPSWAIAAETLHPEATWRWLSYLSRNLPPNAQQMLPARTSLVEQARFWRDLPADEAAVYRYVLDNLAGQPDFLGDPHAFRLYEQLGQVARGEVSVAELRSGKSERTGSARPANASAPTITFAAPRDDVPAYRRAADAFAEQGGSVRVEVVAREDLIDPSRAETGTLWSEMRQIARRADAVGGPEVAALVRSGRAEGALYDLTGLLQNAPAALGFYPNTLESLQWNERTWAAPHRVRPYVIYYNKWMFDQMSVPYPEIGWTWNDFARTVEAVTRQGEDKLKWWGFRDGFGNQLVLLSAATGPLVDYETSPPRPLLAEPRVVEAIRHYGELVRRGFVTVPETLIPGIGGQSLAPADNAAPDDAAMWVGLAEADGQDDLRQAGIGSVSFPVGAPTEGTTPFEIRNAFAISAASERPEAAWEWIDFLLTFDPFDRWSRNDISAWRYPDVLTDSRMDPEALALYKFALEHARRADPLRREEYHAQQALRTAVARVARGVASAETALAEAQAAAEAAIGR